MATQAEITDFQAQAVRDTLSTWAERSDEKMMSKFGITRQEIGLLGVFDKFTDGLLDAKDKSALRNQVEGQSHKIQGIYRKKADGTGTSRIENGAGGTPVSDYSPDFQEGIQDGFADTFVSNVIRQSTSDDMADKGSRARSAMIKHYDKNLSETMANMIQRKASQAYNWLVTQSWDLSTDDTDFANLARKYNTYSAANVVNIPNSDVATGSADRIPVWIQDLIIDARYLRFTQHGAITLLHDGGVASQIARYTEKGSNQNTNVSGALNNFNYVWDPRVAKENDSDEGSFFMIANNSLAVFDTIFPYHKHEAAVNGIFQVGNKYHMPPIEIGSGTQILGDLPNMRFEHFRKMDIEDNTGINNIDPSKLDITSRSSLYHRQGFAISKDFDLASKSPVVRYALRGV